MSLLGSIAGAVIGGIFKKKAAKDAHASAVSDTLLQLPRLRQSAEDAGFNPLTALLANGGGSFNAGGMQAAPLASASVIQNAVDSVSDEFTGKAEIERQKDKTNLELAKVELERLKSGGASSTVAATQKNRVPSMGAPARVALGGSAATPKKPKFTQLGPSEYGETLVTNPNPAQSGMWVDPRRPDAEHAEQRYGDVMQEVAGAGNLAQDMVFTKQIDQVSYDYGPKVANRVVEYLRKNPKASVDEAINQSILGMQKRVSPKVGPMESQTLLRTPPTSQDMDELRRYLKGKN